MTSQSSDRTGRLYLARHGRTDLNARGLLRGRLDPDLDAAGRDEALRLADALVASGVAAVVSSPLRRAIQTAEAIASSLGLSIRSDARLADRDYGRWAGCTVEQVEAEWGSVDDAPGVEPLADVRARALEALGEIQAGARSPSVAVSHDAVNRTVLGVLDPTLRDANRVAQPTGCVNVLDWDDGSWSVRATGLLPTDPQLGALQRGALERRSNRR